MPQNQRGTSSPLHGRRVAIVHDYLTQRGGAERVALAMLKCFPEAVLYTTLYNPETTFVEFKQYDIRTTRLNDFPIFRRDPRRALPLLAQAIGSIEIEDADVVLVSTSGWAHGVVTPAPVVAYCHTPARWLYEGANYFKGAPTGLRKMFDLATPALRRWDRSAAERVERYVSNSTVVRERIRRVYGLDSETIFPPSALTADGPRKPVDGVEPGFLLTVGRSRGYKNTDRICEAVSRCEDKSLVVVGDLPQRTDGCPWDDRIKSAKGVTDCELRWLYENCSAVVAMSHEDFGLTPIEGFSFGAPAVALEAGGYLDSCSEDAVAVRVPDLEIDSIVTGIRELDRRNWVKADIRTHARRFDMSQFRDRITAVLHDVIEGAAGTDDLNPASVLREGAG